MRRSRCDHAVQAELTDVVGDLEDGVQPMRRVRHPVQPETRRCRRFSGQACSTCILQARSSNPTTSSTSGSTGRSRASARPVRTSRACALQASTSRSSLIAMHAQMVDLMRERVIARRPTAMKGELRGDEGFGARVVSMDIPRVMARGPARTCAACASRTPVSADGCRITPSTGRALRWRSSSMAPGPGRSTSRRTCIAASRWQFLFEVTPPAARAPLRPATAVARRAPAATPNTWAASRPARADHASGEYQRGTESRRASGTMPFAEVHYGPAGTRSVVAAIAHDQVLKRPRPVRGRGTTSAPEQEAPRRAAVPTRGVWHEHNLPHVVPQGRDAPTLCPRRNRDAARGHASHPEGRWVELVVYLGATLHRTARIPKDVAPGRTTSCSRSPSRFRRSRDAGKWTVTVSFVEQHVAWFHDSGMAPLVVEVRAEEPAQGAAGRRACAIARHRMAACGCRPKASRAAGRDTAIRRSSSRRRVVASAIPTATSGSTTSWPVAPPYWDMRTRRCRPPSRASSASSAVSTLCRTCWRAKATEMLCDLIPCAEMVLFGKHGSDSMHRGHSYRTTAHGAPEGAVQRVPRLARLVRARRCSRS